MSRPLARATVALALLGALVAFATAAGASPVVGGGLAESFACPDGASPCSSLATFTLDPQAVAAATGSIVLGATTAEITLSVPSITMTGASGSVTALAFSVVSYSATLPISQTDLGGGLVQVQQALGFATGTVSGSVDAVGGPGPGPFGDASVSFSNLQCLLVNGQGQCGFNVGSFRDAADFGLDVDGSPHDVVQTFNVVVPEPRTLPLIALGLLTLASRSRRPRA